MNSRRLNGLIIPVLILITVSVYWPVHRFDFLKFDDDIYVYNSPHVKAGLTWEGIRWAFTADLFNDDNHADFWIPLTLISHMFVVQFFGMDPSSHHVMNLAIHTLNSVLLFVVFQRMTGAVWTTAFVAGLFAVHPLHVESVAWVTERKDVLSGFFLMLTLLAYTLYRERPGPVRYALVGVSFIMGLMAKPMLVTLPVLLFLLDFWPFNRFALSDFKTAQGRYLLGRIIAEKAPFLFLSGFFSVVTFYAVKGAGSLIDVSGQTIPDRIIKVAVSYAAYLGKAVWPQKLAVFYPDSSMQISVGVAVLSILIFIIISSGAFWMARDRPYFIVGWLWFLVAFLPVIGIIPAGSQVMADRYTYIPLIGFYIVVAWGGRDVAKRWKLGKMLLFPISAVILLALALKANNQTDHWRNSEVLFRQAIRVTENNVMALHGLGLERFHQGRLDEAESLFLEAIRIDPNFDRAHNNLGNTYVKMGRQEEALKHYRHALQIKPGDETIYSNIGILLYQQGNVDLAGQYFGEAIQRNPDNPAVQSNMGVYFMKRGNLDKAEVFFEKALQLDPNDSVSRGYLERIRTLKNRGGGVGP